MTFTLGQAPEKLTVVLVAGADFVSSLDRSDGEPWPDVEISLDFGTAVWPATLDGASARWNVDQADVDALLATRPRSVRLWYVDGPTRLLWAQGAIKQS